MLDAHLDLLLAQPVTVAPEWAAGLPAQLGLDLWPLPVLVVTLAHLRSGSPDRRLAAGAILDDLRGLLGAASIARRWLQIDLQTVLLLGQSGDSAAALDLLERCVARSVTSRPLRAFVDTGPQLLPYLQELVRRNVSSAPIAQILNAYAPVAADPAALASRPSVASPMTTVPLAPPVLALAPATPAASLPPALTPKALTPEALTNRELDVLLLLDRRLSNQEIGDLLYISPRTVKRHTAAIYQKLHVNSRRAAVARARALGLMPSA